MIKPRWTVLALVVLALVALAWFGGRALWTSIAYVEDPVVAALPEDVRIPRWSKRWSWLPGSETIVEQCGPCQDGLHDRCAAEVHFSVTPIRSTLANLDASFRFKGSSLEDIVAFLSAITDLEIAIDPALARGTPLTAAVNGLRLRDGIPRLLESAGFGYTFRNNKLYVTRANSIPVPRSIVCPCTDPSHD